MKDAAELCRGLLRKARSDRIAMEASLAAQAFDAACFHAQQITEKCLKAFLAYSRVGFPYTHNLAKRIASIHRTDPEGVERFDPFRAGTFSLCTGTVVFTYG